MYKLFFINSGKKLYSFLGKTITALESSREILEGAAALIGGLVICILVIGIGAILNIKLLTAIGVLLAIGWIAFIHAKD